jgi:hypothetical protein
MIHTTKSASTGTKSNKSHSTRTPIQRAQFPSRPGTTRRPGRFYSHIEEGTDDVLTSYGDNVNIKDSSSLRIWFQNVKGLTTSSTGEDYEYYLHNLQLLQVDIAGMAETNSPWQLPHVRSDFIQQTRKYDSISKTVFGIIDYRIDPVAAKEKYQAGGCLTLIKGPWTTTVQREEITDSSGLGRWTGITITGRYNKALSVITGYRTCNGSIHTSGVNTTYHREHEFYRSRGVTSPQPRERFLNELEDVIKHLQNQGNAILVMLDANDILSTNGSLAKWVGRLDLHDVHSSHPAPSTYLGSKTRRIDYMFGCTQIMGYIKASGTLSYLQGPQSDHRSLFVDIDIQGFIKFDAYSNNHSPSNARLLRTGNPELVAQYTQEMLKYYECHSMEQRIDSLRDRFTTMAPHDILQELEAWDRDQGRAMKSAERSLRIPKPLYVWSPQLRNAGIIRRYWRLRLREIKHNEDFSPTIGRLQDTIRQSDPSFRLPHAGDRLTITEIRQQLKTATKTLHEMQKGSVEMRFRSYQDLLALYKADTDPVTKPESNRKAKIVNRTIRTERIRRMFRNIRNTIKGIMPSQQTGLNHIKIPKTHQDSQSELRPDEYQSFIENEDPNSISWEAVLDQQRIEHYLLQYNRKSFRAAATSPCGHGIIYNALSFTSLTFAAKQFLEGVIPQEWYGNDTLLRDFLMEFRTPAHICERPPIKTTMSTEEIASGISKWKESTSTSPSGRHLGHYKAIIQDHTLLKCLTQFMYIAVKSGTSISRWANATNVMLEKDMGNPCIHRLRIIHLFEADFNLYLKLQWGKRLTRRAVKHKLLNSGQFGSVPQRTALEPIFLTQLTNDNCRILKLNLARFDNDASACFDRIIVPLAMLAARRCGMSTEAVKIHSETLRSMHYSVKTQFGLSRDSYTGTADEPLFGTGQGSGASPAAWLSLVVLIMNTLDKVVKERVNFRSPDYLEHHTRLIDAFVDDTSLSFTTEPDSDVSDMTTKLSTIASNWNRLLFFSGGSLNLKKCSYHLTMWEWKKGRPCIRDLRPTDPTVCVTSIRNGVEEPIRYQPYSRASRILGVYLSPSGDFAHQVEILKQKADTYAARLGSPRISTQDVMTFLRTTYIPAMGYVLPSLAMDEEGLTSIQSSIMAVVLQKLGASSKTPVALRHGPIDMGGLGLPDLRTEMGVSQLKLIRTAITRQTEVGTMLILSIKYSQIEAGIKEPILERPDILVSYLTPTWITSVRQFLYQHNLSLTFTNSIQIRFQGCNDACIMDHAKLKHHTPGEQLDINLVRLHLQVITLSDISTANGRSIHPCAFMGQRIPGRRNRSSWPRQTNPTKSQIGLWQQYLRANFLKSNNNWNRKLGDVDDKFNAAATEPQQHECPGVSVDPREYHTLRQYLRAMPRWHRRLIDGYEQVASDVQIWRAFRRKDRIVDIASDGGLSNSAIGTYGWKIVTTFANRTEVTLFQGSGFVDGPSEVGSSTRSELGGFTAPLFLATALARFWAFGINANFGGTQTAKLPSARCECLLPMERSEHILTTPIIC